MTASRREAGPASRREALTVGRRSELGACLVARVHPLGEADLVVSLLSPQLGRIDAMARGARNSRKRFPGGLRLFAEVQAAVQVGRGSLPLLVEATPERFWLDDAVGYGELCLASYATELALVASQPGHADPGLYAWLRACLALAAAGVDGHLRGLRLACEVSFLLVVGLMPDLQRCARCGAALTGQVVWPEPRAPTCLACADGGPRLGPATLAALQALLARGPSRETAMALAAEPLRVAEDRVARLLAEAVHSPLRSAAPLAELAAREG